MKVRTFQALDGELALREFGSPEIADRVAKAFSTGMMEGLMQLVTCELGARLPATISYVRAYAVAICNHWVISHRVSGAAPGGPPPGLVESWTALGRDVPGLENLAEKTLHSLWNSLRRFIHDIYIKNNISIVEGLMRWDPWWENIGAPYLRLSEEGDEEERPFVLASGFISGMNVLSRIVCTAPLSGPILGESRVPGLGRYLYSLLRTAGGRSDVIRRLVDSQEIFRPCPLIPRDAHAFLRDANAIEELGFRISLPRGWRDAKPVSIRVRTRIGTAAPTAIGIQPLLGLETSYVVGDHEMSEAEYCGIVHRCVDGLVRVKDKWLQIDQARIDAAHEQWKRTEALKARGGVTFAEALELTGTANLLTAEESEGASDESVEEFSLGPWFAEAIAAIRRHDLRRDFNPGVHLRGKIRGYQRQGVAWLSLLMEVGVGACLADDMGLGKTYQIIALIVALKSREFSGPHLIVAPASLLGNWAEEFRNWAPTLDVQIVHGGAHAAPAPDKVTITSYSTLIRRPTLQDEAWGLVVLDEAQTIKNPEAKLTRGVKRLRSRMRICLTGTPVENHLGDLWSIMDFLNPGLLGSSEQFRAWCKGLLKSPEGLAPLRKVVRPFILRRLKTDPEVASSLPAKVEVPVYCPLTALQADLYGRAYNSTRVKLEAAEGIARHGLAFALLTHLKQICNHPAQYLGDHNYDPYSSGKFACLTQVASRIAAQGERVLVFTQYQEITTALAAHLESVFGRAGIIIDGRTPVKRRQDLVTDFQREDGPPFVILTYKVGGTGFNLTAACHVIHFDRWYNPAVENQATDRAYRLGQTKGVVVHKFVCRGTLEEKIEELLQVKKAIADGVLATDDEEPVNLGDLSPEDLLTLAALDPARARDGDEPSED